MVLAEAKEAEDEEQKKQQLEVFEEPELPALKLDQCWTMWEHYETASQQTTSFEEQMSIVCWFNDIASFSSVWSRIPHKDLNNFFYDRKTKEVPT